MDFALDSSAELLTCHQSGHWEDPSGNQQQDRLCVQAGLRSLKSQGRLIFTQYQMEDLIALLSELDNWHQ